MKDDQFMGKIGGTLSSVIPQKLREAIGLTAEVNTLFVWKTMLVMEVRIIAADAVRVIERFGSDQRSEFLRALLDLFQGGALSASLNHTLALIIGERLQDRLGPTIMEKMDERGLRVEVFAAPMKNRPSFCLPSSRRPPTRRSDL